MIETHSRKCPACGRELTFALSPAGKWLPLAKVANVYTLSRPQGGKLHADPADKSLLGDFYVSHYVDCPQAEQFRKRDRTGEPQ